MSLALPLLIRSVAGFNAMVRYKHVSCPCIRGVSAGWVAQKRGVGYRARFPTQRHAAKWMAARLGVPVDSLRLGRAGVKAKAKSELPRERYLGVTAVRGRWVARWRGRVLGRFGDQLGAAESVAAAAGVEVRGLRRKGLPDHVARRVFGSAYQVFRDYVPGDYQSMIAHETASAQMYKQDSCVIPNHLQYNRVYPPAIKRESR